MSNERIDLTQYEYYNAWDFYQDKILATEPNLGIIALALIAELRKMYEREDALVSAIKELCDSEDSTGCSGDLTVVSLDPMLKLYELTSYSAYR